MKILLIVPPYTNFEGMKESGGHMLSLGLAYIAAYSRSKTNDQREILDTEVEGLNYDQIKDRIKRSNPDICGFNCPTPTMAHVGRLTALIKQTLPACQVILGGIHPTVMPQRTMEETEADFAVIGEGEITFYELVLAIKQGQANFSKIKGLAWRDGQKIIINGPRDFIKNLDELPFPARDLFNLKLYYSAPTKKVSEENATPILTSRGCPFNCIHCCSRVVWQGHLRFRSAQNVLAEIEECVNKYDLREFNFFDDTFTANRQRVLDICAKIKEKGLTIAWDIRTRVNTVDEELLRAIKAAGCQRIHYGVEAGTQKILNVLRKGITVEQVEKAFALTKKIGIQTAGYFMIGSPTETREDILATIKLIRKIDPEYVHISITTPFPATDLYRLALEQKVIASDCWKEFAQNPQSNFLPPLWEKELSRQELSALLKKAYRSFYLRPGYILKRLRQIKSPAELFQKAKAALRMITM